MTVKVLRLLRAGVERLAVTLIVWVPLMLAWRLILGWYSAGLANGQDSVIDAEPSDLIVFLPIGLLILAWLLAGQVIRRLERHWSRRDS